MARRETLNFSSVDASALDPISSPATTGKALFEFEDAAPLTVDLTKLPVQGIVRPLLDALVHRAQLGGPSRRPDTIGSFAKAIAKFALYLGEVENLPAGISVKELERSHLDSYEDHLRQHYPEGSRTPAVFVNKVVVLLRQTSASKKLDAGLKARIMFSVNGEWGEHIPVEPYPSELLSILNETTRKQCSDMIREFPQRRQSLPTSHAVTLALASLQEHGALHDPAIRNKLSKEGGRRLGLIYNAHYPSKGDLSSFMIRLALLTGWEPSVLAGLKIDCLREESGGYVRVKLTKYRRHSQAHFEDSVRDGNLDTPGGVIRAVISMTAEVRKWFRSDSLWIGWTLGKGGPFRAFDMTSAAALWIAEAGIVDEDGRPLTQLSVRRLRKSKKHYEYREARGDITKFARGHSLTVAAKHYADTEANRDLHENTIESALNDVVGVASRAEVKPKATSAAQEEAAPEQTQTSVSHWVCRCGDFLASPYVQEGNPCNVGFLMCLACPNSKISLENLPALLALSDHLGQQAEHLSEVDWKRRYALPWVWLQRDILPQFNPAQIQSAREKGVETSFKVYLGLLEGGE